MHECNHAAVAFELTDVDGLEAMLAAMPPDLAAQADSHGVVVSTIAVYIES